MIASCLNARSSRAAPACLPPRFLPTAPASHRPSRTHSRVAAAAAAGAAAPSAQALRPLRKYETCLVLKPTLTNEERDQELARFESFLISEECEEINTQVKGRHRMAYPIKGNWEGIYTLVNFKAKPATATKVQLLLSKPDAGREDIIMRHLTQRY